LTTRLSIKRRYAQL